MKRNVIISIYLSFLAAASGQGTVDLRNNVFRAVDTPFFDEQGQRLEGPSYQAQLYYWLRGEGFRPAGTPVGFATNGYFFGGPVTLPYVGGGSPAWVQVRAWQTAGGTTFEQAALAGAWTGVSGILFIPITGDPTSFPPSAAATLLGLEYPGTPVIVRQPEDQTVKPGQRSTLSVVASSGVRMFYQWHQYPGERPDESSGVIAGATNATYNPPIQLTPATYWVSVSNRVGSVSSDRATITVVSRPWLYMRQVSGFPAVILDGALAGPVYRLQYSTNLSAGTWTTLVDLTLVNPPFTFLDAHATNSPSRFYRVVVP